MRLTDVYARPLKIHTVWSIGLTLQSPLGLNDVQNAMDYWRVITYGNNV